MARIAILRLEKRKMSGAAAMSRHALREAQVTNAVPERHHENRVLVGAPTTAGVMADLRSRLPVNRRKDAVLAVEFFVGASPEAIRAMPERDQDRYFENALDWIGKHFGGRQNIVQAVVHRDESSPHMQVLIVPLLDGKLNAKKLVGNRKDMEDMQTSFAAEVGATVGLERGLKGSKAKHTSIRQFYSAIEQAGKGEKLPPRVEMPPALPEPGFFASKTEKEAFEKRQKEREAAAAANRKRQAEIERLAQIGVAVKGKAARTDLPQIRADLNKAAGVLKATNRELEKKRNELTAETASASQQIAAAKKELEAIQNQAAIWRENTGINAIKKEKELLWEEYKSMHQAVQQMRAEKQQLERDGPGF